MRGNSVRGGGRGVSARISGATGANNVPVQSNTGGGFASKTFGAAQPNSAGDSQPKTEPRKNTFGAGKQQSSGTQENKPQGFGVQENKSQAFGAQENKPKGFGTQENKPKGFGKQEDKPSGGAFDRPKQFGRIEIKEGDGAAYESRRPRVGRLGGYVPKDRNVDEIFKEDEASKGLYSTIFQTDEEVLVTGANESVAMIEKWADVALDANIMRNIESAGYIHPRKIQSFAIPLILSGYDLKAQAETGSGKSAAFLIPLIQKVINDKKDLKPGAVKNKAIAFIIEPTRELTLQLYEQARKLAHKSGVAVTKCYGQYDPTANGQEILFGCDIVVATPGRLLDFVEHGVIDVTDLKYFVLDEADRLMAAPDFMEIIKKIRGVSSFPPKDKLQNLLFSATFPKEVEKLAEQLLNARSVFVHNEHVVAANSKVDMTFVECPSDVKKTRVLKILQDSLDAAKAKDPDAKQPRTLVFVQRRSDADLMALFLSEAGLRATTINGDRPQAEREKALNCFRSDTTPILVATDVCARGLDIKDLDFVINMDLPDQIETFVHRIGRTGRLKEGKALSLFDVGTDQGISAALVKLLEEGKKNTVPQFLRDASKAAPTGTGSFAKPAGFGTGGGGFGTGSGFVKPAGFGKKTEGGDGFGTGSSAKPAGFGTGSSAKPAGFGTGGGGFGKAGFGKKKTEDEGDAGKNSGSGFIKSDPGKTEK